MISIQPRRRFPSAESRIAESEEKEHQKGSTNTCKPNSEGFRFNSNLIKSLKGHDSNRVPFTVSNDGHPLGRMPYRKRFSPNRNVLLFNMLDRLINIIDFKKQNRPVFMGGPSRWVLDQCSFKGFRSFIESDPACIVGILSFQRMKH